MKVIDKKLLKEANNEELLELLKVIASSYSDFNKYYAQCINMIEHFDETMEYYDFESWLMGGREEVGLVISGLNEAEDFLGELEEEASANMWIILEYLKEEKKDLFINEFGFYPENISLEDLKEFLVDRGLFDEMEKAYALDDNYNNIKEIIKYGYYEFIAENYKYDERPFYNDNFVILKLMKDHQTKIKNENYILLSLRDISSISGFNLNKVQNIVSMLIKWDYIKVADKGKYQLTKQGNEIIEALMKVPVTKIVE